MEDIAGPRYSRDTKQPHAIWVTWLCHAPTSLKGCANVLKGLSLTPKPSRFTPALDTG